MPHEESHAKQSDKFPKFATSDTTDDVTIIFKNQNIFIRRNLM